MQGDDTNEPILYVVPYVVPLGVNKIGILHNMTDSAFDLAELRYRLLEWERTYNAVRPHQSLGYLPPLQFLEQRKENQRKEMGCH